MHQNGTQWVLTWTTLRVGLKSTLSERCQTHKAASSESISMRSWERQGQGGGSERLGWGTEEFGATAPFRVS